MDTYDKAIAKFGKELQLIVAIEELSELQKELCKSLRGKTVFANIAEEIADVEIMLEQVKRIFKCSGSVDVWKESKLQRLERKIEGNE